MGYFLLASTGDGVAGGGHAGRIARKAKNARIAKRVSRVKNIIVMMTLTLQVDN